VLEQNFRKCETLAEMMLRKQRRAAFYVQGSESMYYESSIESGSLDVRRKEMGESFCLN